MSTKTAAAPKRDFSGEIREMCPNTHVAKFIQESVELCKPDKIFWCDGSIEERQKLLKQGVADGVFVELNQKKLPG